MPEERPLFDRLLAAQVRIGVITKGKTNPWFESKYADINIILDIVKPILNDEGILVMQPLSNVDGKPALTTILMRGSERFEYTTVFPDLPQPKEGKKSNPAQEMGSTITYYRRYALISILGLEAIDTDGNDSSQSSAPKKEQQKAQQTDGAVEVPNCSICGQPMKPQKSNPSKFFCKHTGENGSVKWGSPINPKQTKVA